MGHAGKVPLSRLTDRCYWNEATVADAPFVVLARERANGGGETWVVRDWEPRMAAYFDVVGASLKDVIDLDLEDGFVELLRTFRAPRP